MNPIVKFRFDSQRLVNCSFAVEEVDGLDQRRPLVRVLSFSIVCAIARRIMHLLFECDSMSLKLFWGGTIKTYYLPVDKSYKIKWTLTCNFMILPLSWGGSLKKYYCLVHESSKIQWTIACFSTVWASHYLEHESSKVRWRISFKRAENEAKFMS